MRSGTLARTFCLALAVVAGIAAGVSGSPVTESLERVVSAAGEYRAALERVLVFREAGRDRAERELAKVRELADRGIVARRDVADAERAVTRAREEVADTTREIEQADQTIAEARAEQEIAARPRPPAPAPPGATTDVYTGTHRWSLSQASAIERFYTAQFGHPLPVSAFGQTAVHDKLGFDHRNALDVAIHPDSLEGRALVAWLTEHGVPFIAFRGPRPGASTGAHVHIGAPSLHKG